MEEQTVQTSGRDRKRAFIAITEASRGNGADVAEDVLKVRIFLDEDRYFQIGTSMNNQEKAEMLLFLLQNVDVFAWSPYEVPGVDPDFIVHKLNVDPSFHPKKKNRGDHRRSMLTR